MNLNNNTESNRLTKKPRIEPFQPVFDLKRFAVVGPTEFNGLKYCIIKKNKTEGADSNCMYFVKFSYQHAINSSERSPCTNRPVVCMQCKQCIWSYNILIHYNEVHPGVLILETCQPNDKEIKQVLSLKI